MDSLLKSLLIRSYLVPFKENGIFPWTLCRHTRQDYDVGSSLGIEARRTVTLLQELKWRLYKLLKGLEQHSGHNLSGALYIKSSQPCKVVGCERHNSWMIVSRLLNPSPTLSYFI